MTQTEKNDKKLPFSLFRAGEVSKLQKMSGNATKVMMAIRFGRWEGESFVIGCRDLEEWGLKRTTGWKVLKELVNAKLLKVVKEGSFGTRGKKTSYEIVHTKAYEEKQAADTNNCTIVSPLGRTVDDERVREHRQQRQKESVGADIPKETSSTSSQKSKDEEVSTSATAAAVAAAAERLAKEERAEREALDRRKQNMRIGKAADAVGKLAIEFKEQVGSWEAAEELAMKFERGELTPQQLRARLAVGDAGLVKKCETQPVVDIESSQRDNKAGGSQKSDDAKYIVNARVDAPNNTLRRLLGDWFVKGKNRLETNASNLSNGDRITDQGAITREAKG